MIALIDGDNLAFACAASAEDAEEAWVACSRAQNFVETILRETQATKCEIWLSGPDNFRYKVYPEYKGNRKDAYRPKWEKDVKDYLTIDWKANWSEGCEADDMLVIRHQELIRKHFDPISNIEDVDLREFESILCHLDKDINQSAGLHYNWELKRLGNVVREAKIYTVDPWEADRFFWHQLIVGDSTDNIKGVPGLGPKKAESILLGVTTNGEAYERVREEFSCDEELDMNAQCVYIWRKRNDNWKNLIDKPSI